MLSCESVASACGAPLANVQQIWPLVEADLRARGSWTKNIAVAAAATIAVETGVSVHGVNQTFLPIHELGGDAYFTQHYEGRSDLGNTESGDGALFHGRGLIQTTGRNNYIKVGEAIGVELLSNPDELLVPETAARAFGWQFAVQLRAAGAAENGDWLRCRKRVNGGTNGLDKFIEIVAKLLPLWGDE